MKKEINAEEKLVYERELIRGGAKYVAGVDEVGRGPLAGPVEVFAHTRTLHFPS